MPYRTNDPPKVAGEKAERPIDDLKPAMNGSGTAQVAYLILAVF
jgi:hypothetical protein